MLNSNTALEYWVVLALIFGHIQNVERRRCRVIHVGGVVEGTADLTSEFSVLRSGRHVVGQRHRMY